MKTPFVLFTDLDDTLFQSHRKQTPQDGSQAMAFLSSGEPVSYANPTQQQWLAHWMSSSVVIPVTARNLDAFRRVRIAFRHHAIINYGGLILLPDGSLDTQWMQHSAQQARHSLPRLQALMAALQQRLPPAAVADLHIRLITDQDIPFYLLVKSRSHQPMYLQQAAELLQALRQPEEKLHLNANNLALLPPWLDKRHAVTELLHRYRQQQPGLISIGMGDSRIDLAFMHVCDYLITPQGSQIAQQLPPV